MSAVAQLKPFSLAKRALFVKCVPAPKDFFERRTVLAALQQASRDQIEGFKKLSNASSFMVITTNPEVAGQLKDASPLVRSVTRQDSSESETSVVPSWILDFQEGGPITTNPEPLVASDKVGREESRATAQLGLSTRQFTLSIFPMEKQFSHFNDAKRKPLHGRWPVVPYETYMASALKQEVPVGVMSRGLRDWETGNQLAHDLDDFADGDPDGAVVKLLGRQVHPSELGDSRHAAERIRNKAMATETPGVMRSLNNFAETCRIRFQNSATKPMGSASPPKADENAGDGDGSTIQDLIDFNEKFANAVRPDEDLVFKKQSQRLLRRRLTETRSRSAYKVL